MEDIFYWLQPRFIIEVGGLLLLLTVVFAETGLLIGFFLPGDSLLFTAGLLAGTGQFSIALYYLLPLTTAAAILGDNLNYWIGRRIGKALYNKKETWYFKREYIVVTRAYFQRYGAITLIIGRFLPIVRTFAPLLAGVSMLSYRRYLMYSLIGGILWVNTLIPIGYFLGSLLPETEDYLGYIVLVLVVITTFPILRRLWMERRRAKERLKKKRSLSLEKIS